MKIEYIEGLLVCLILLVQIRLFFNTSGQIKRYKYALPGQGDLTIRRCKISTEKLMQQDPTTILLGLKKQETMPPATRLEGSATDELIETGANGESEQVQTMLSIIECGNCDSDVFKNVLHSLNTYLIRNHGASPDFHLVKDIVERNIGAIEEDINLTISLPLYLGLMGTMLGIVIGLFNIPDLSLVLDSSAKDAQLNTGIGLLIGGVKVAMIASFAGLLFTIVNSGWIFKGSRSLVEAHKNEFYTFIQTELLPVLNQSMGSTLVSLQRNLQVFNQDFTVNLDRLSDIFHTSHEAITSQERVLSKLENIDISQIAKFNITVLKELQNSTAEFQQFNVYLHSMNSFVENSRQLAGKANDLFERSGNFEAIARNLENKLDQSQALLEFLGRHFQDLENHKNYVNGTVAEVGHAISGTFRDLQVHIQHSTDNVRQFTVDEIDALRSALSESRTNLGNLAFLESLNKDVSQFKTDAGNQGDRLGKLLTDLQGSMLRSVTVLEQIQQSSLSYKMKHLFTKDKSRR